MSKFVGESALQALLENLRDKFYINAGRKANTTKGSRSTAEGIDNTASGNYSHAEGYSTIASGLGSHTEGSSTQAIGDKSHAEGDSTRATNNASHSEGKSSRATGMYSHAEGNETRAIGKGSHAEGFGDGDNNFGALGDYSHSEGNRTKASGVDSHAEGLSSTASGLASHAEGSSSIASDINAHAEGGSTKASGTNSHAEGAGSQASGIASHAEGNMTKAVGDNSHSEGSTSQALGLSSHAEGYVTIASGDYSHAEGYNTQASGDYSHIEGYSNTTSGVFSHVEGESNTNTGMGNHTEGFGNNTSGRWSHAEGGSNSVSGNYSHVEGELNVVTSDWSHAEGHSTIAQRTAQHVFGEYNIADTEGADATVKGKYVEIVGNGDPYTRSNARTLDWSGNEILKGKLTVGVGPTENMDVATKQYVDTEIDKLVGIEFDGPYNSLDDLETQHPTGDKNKIYLVSNESSEDSIYDEYLWVSEGSEAHYELIGTTRVDLSNYATKDEVTRVEINDQAQGLPIRGLSKLIINKLTREQYDESEISEDELYFIVDDSTIKGPYPSVDDLPQKGYDNYIYLVSVESSDATDMFDEYIWVESSEYTGYEQFGSSRIDLSNYATKDEATKVKIRDWRVL